LLKEQDLNLAKLCQIAQIIETADHQAKQYDSKRPNNESGSDDEINKITASFQKTRFRKSNINIQP